MMRLFPLLVVGAMISSACGCILPAENSNAANDQVDPAAGANAQTQKSPETPADGLPERDPRIAPNWQDDMLSRLKNDKNASEAWGLFSEGGWSDNGQVMILADVTGRTATTISHGKSAPQLVLIAPGKRSKPTTRELKETEWKAFSPAMQKAAALKSVQEEVFDALIYEYVHAKKAADGSVKVEQSIMVKLAQVGPYPAHEEMLQAFNQFKEFNNRKPKK